MTVVKYNVKGVERGSDFSTPIPVGLYKMRIANCEQKPSKSSGEPMIELELEVVNGDHKGRKVWDYIVLNEASEWKLAQLIDALQLKDKGSFNTDKLSGTVIMVKTKNQGSPDDEYGVQSKVASLLPMPEDAEEEEEEEEEEPDEEEEGDLTWEELQEYDRGELKELIKENELEIKVTKSKKDEALRSEIAEALEIEEEESEEDDDEETDADYDEMTLAELKSELKSRELKTSGTKKALVKRLEKADKDGGSDDDEPF